jgi:DNA-binding NarL/FixJ family response regulator
VQPLIAVIGYKPDCVARLTAFLLAQSYVLSLAPTVTIILDEPSGSGLSWLEGRSMQRIVFVTENPCQEYWLNTLSLGLRSFLAGTVNADDITAAVNAVAANGTYIKHPSIHEPLSSPERLVLAAIGDGLEDQEIAERLGIKNGTVRNRVSQMMERLRYAHPALRLTSRMRLAFYYLGLWHKIERPKKK